MSEPVVEETNMDAVYAPGEVVNLVADFFPAKVQPYPSFLPRGKIRVIITERAVFFAWASGTGVASAMMRYDIDTAPSLNYRGGRINGLALTRGPGCACGSRGVRSWMPFAGRAVTISTRTQSPAYPQRHNYPTKAGR